MEVQKDDLQVALQAKQQDLEALRDEFQLFKEEALEYEKELEADNQYKEKEIEGLKKKLETALAKTEECRKEIIQLEKIQDREKQTYCRIKGDYDSMKSTMVKLEQDNEDFESQLRNVDFEKKELKEKIERLEEANILDRETLTEKLNKDQEEIERLRRELQEYKEEVIVLSKKANENTISPVVEDKSEEVAKQARMIEELQNKIIDLENAILEKDRAIKELEKKIEELGNEVHDEEVVERLTREVEKYASEIESIKEIHKKDIESRTVILDEKIQVADQQGKEIIELQDEIIHLRMKLDEKENKIKEKDENIEFLTVELRAKESEAAAEIDQIEMIRHELDRLSMELIEALKEKQELAGKLQEENLRNNEHLQETEKDKEKTKQEKDKEIIFLKLELAHIKEDMAGHNEEIKKLKDEINDKNTKIKGLEEENARLSRGSKKRQDSEDPKTRLGREDVGKIKEENANLIKENKKLKLRIANKEKEIDQLADEVIQMRSCIEEERDKLLAIEKDFEASRLEKTEMDFTPVHQQDISDFTIEKQRLETEPKRQSAESKRLAVPDVRVRSVSPHIGFSLTPVLEEIGRERSKDKSAEKSPLHKTKQTKLIFKHLYAKLGKNGVPPYLSLDYDKKTVNIVKGTVDMKSPRKVYKTNVVDSIVHKPSDLNVKEMIEKAQGGAFDPQMVGKNLFYIIYGQKKTDKKHLKYKILQGFSDTFRNIARKSEYADKICKLIIRVQDGAINRKAEILKHNSFLQQLKSYSEFTLGTDKGEKDFEDFLAQMKQIDTTLAKSVFGYGLSKGKTNPKQIFIEFSIEKGGSSNGSKKSSDDMEDGRLDYSQLSEIDEGDEQTTQPQETEYLTRTKIMLVCTNSIKEESYFEGLNSIDSLIDLIMTDDKPGVSRKEKPVTSKIVTDNVVKHFIMTTAPILQNYKATYNTISLVTKLSQFTKDRSQRSVFEHQNSSSRPYLHINRNLAKEMDQWKEKKTMQSARKVSISQDKCHDKSSDPASLNCLDKSINDEKKEKKTEENEDLSKQMKYYSNKQEALKSNMKNVLGMLNQLISSNQPQNPLQKIKTQRERETEDMTLKRSNTAKVKQENVLTNGKPMRQPSSEKTPKARKIGARVN